MTALQDLLEETKECHHSLLKQLFANCPVESNVEKWSPMDQGGWGRALATAKAVTVSLKGKRSVGDKGNDYVYTVLWKDGLDCSTKYSIEFPDGSSITGNCVLDVKAAPGGDSTNVAALELDIIFDGKPTFVPAPATPEGGA